MAQQRPEMPKDRPLDAPLLTFDLPALLKQIKSEDNWQKTERNAMTLLKTQEMRVVLVALHAGTVIPSHKADGPISVQAIEGQIKFSAVSQTVTLRKGQMLTLQSGLPHSVEAVEESAFLLTVASESAPPAER